MYNDIYTKQYQKPELYIDLDFPKFLVIIITIVGFFVLPAMAGTYFLNQSNFESKATEKTVQVASVTNKTNSQANVAGVNKIQSEEVVIFGIDFSQKQNQLIGLGVIFLLLSLTTVLYLLSLDSQKDPHTNSDVVW